MGDSEIRIAVVRDRPDVGVAMVAGPLDARIVGKLEARLTSTPRLRIRTLILDLDQVRYINSMGMTYLVQLSDRLEALGGELHLANPQPKVKLLLEMMGLTAVFKVHKSVQAALRTTRPKTSSVR